MLDSVVGQFLKDYEKSQECRELRELIIDDKFEENSVEYELACKSLNTVADAYFKIGFKHGVSLAVEIFLHKQDVSSS